MYVDLKVIALYVRIHTEQRKWNPTNHNKTRSCHFCLLRITRRPKPETIDIITLSFLNAGNPAAISTVRSKKMDLKLLLLFSAITFAPCNAVQKPCVVFSWPQGEVEFAWPNETMREENQGKRGAVPIGIKVYQHRYKILLQKFLILLLSF